MEKSGFFNAMKIGDTWDRIYKAENFAEYFSTFIGNGVFPNPATGLQVKETSKMQVILKQGKAWINGFIYINTDDLILDIPVADGVLNRIDKIVLQYDVAKREIRSAVKKGEFASSPTAPILQRDADMYELGLADITVNAGAIKISQSDITDLRLNKSMCGIAHGTVDQVDTTAIFNQFQSWYSQTKDNYDKDIATWTKEKKEEFEKWYIDNTEKFNNQFQEWFKNTEIWDNDFKKWFENIKNKLDGDVATKLTKEVEQIKEQLPKNEGLLLGADGYYYKPFMQDGQIIECNSVELHYTMSGELLLDLDDNYLYSFAMDNQIIKINKKSNIVEGYVKLDDESPYSYLISQNLKSLFILSENKKLYKIDKDTFDIVATTTNDYSYFLECDENYIYTFSYKKSNFIKLNINTLEIVSEKHFNYSFYGVITSDEKYLYCKTGNISKISKDTFNVVAVSNEKDDDVGFYDSEYLYVHTNKNNCFNKIDKSNMSTIGVINFDINLLTDEFISTYNQKYFCMSKKHDIDSQHYDYYIYIFNKEGKLLFKTSQPTEINKNIVLDKENNIYLTNSRRIKQLNMLYEIKYYTRVGGEN